MEQITASIANFILSAAGNGITPYYNELKQGFHVPSIFFPDIEVDGTPEDLDSYALTHSCYVKIFHSTTNDAYALAKQIFKKIVGSRYFVPIVDINGVATGEKIRIKKANIRKVDSGVYQLWLEWDESYVYDDLTIVHEKMQTNDISCNIKE